MYQQDGVGAAVAEVAAGGQVGLLILGESFAAVGADEQPSGAAAGGRPVGIVGEDRDPIQRPVGPDAGSDDSADGHEQQHQDDSSDGWPSPLAAHRCRRGAWGGGALRRAAWAGAVWVPGERAAGPSVAVAVAVRGAWRPVGRRRSGVRRSDGGGAGAGRCRRNGGAPRRQRRWPVGRIAADHLRRFARRGRRRRRGSARPRIAGGTRRSSLTRTIYGRHARRIAQRSQSRCPASSAYPTNATESMMPWATISGHSRPVRRHV